MAALMRGVTGLPVFIDNGVSTMGQAEMWFGAGLGASDTVFLLIGSGIGASMTVGGVSYRGSTTSAGEWGHVTAEVGGRPCRCGARGCLEAYIGAESVIGRFREAAGLDGSGSGSAVSAHGVRNGPADGLAGGSAADAPPGDDRRPGPRPAGRPPTRPRPTRRRRCWTSWPPSAKIPPRRGPAPRGPSWTRPPHTWASASAT